MGAVLAGYVGFAWRLPPVLHVVVAVLAAVVGGAAWGGLAGWLKARTGAHEVISTIMLNYVAFNLLAYLLKTVCSREGLQPGDLTDRARNRAAAASVSGAVAPAVRIPDRAGAAAAMTWLLNRSKTGFALRAVGASPNAARTAGMGVGRAYIVAMVIAGALAGLAGASQILGTTFALTTSIDASFGFDGITVALLGRAKPWPTVAAGILFGALRAGSVTMQTRTGTSIDLVTVLQSLVVLFVAAPMFVRQVFRLRAAGDAGSQQLAKGWNG